MKIFNFIYCVLALTLLFSCLDGVERYEKDLKDLLGEWKLKQMSYTNESGELTDCTDISSSIIFTNNNISQNEGNIDKKGVLIIEDDTIDFVYQFDIKWNTINIEIDRETIKDKPLYAFGKNQVNEYLMSNENTLIFSSDYELVYPTNEKLTNPVYVFVR